MGLCRHGTELQFIDPYFFIKSISDTKMLKFNDISLRRGPRLLFSKVSFVIHRGYKVGLTGNNGSGKSSLFQLVLGELSADTGEFNVTPDLVFASVEQETESDNRPAIEVVVDGDSAFRGIEAELAKNNCQGIRQAELHATMEEIDGYSIRARASKLMYGLGFGEDQLDRPVQAFSGGWRMRLNLAKALMCRSDVLLLDEPTNHLDLDAVIWLQDWLKSYPGTLVLISHDREFLDNVSDHIAHIENQSIQLCPGNYSDFERLKADQLARQESIYARQQREVEHMRAFVTRFKAKATKAKQAQSRLKALQKMDLIVRAQIDSPIHFEFNNPENTPDPLLRLEDLSIGYDDQAVIDSVEITIRPGDRIGLLGANGSGKSTLIKILAGEIQPLQGKIETANGLEIGYFAQHQLEQLNPSESPLQHLQAIDRNASEKELRNYLGGFAFYGDLAIEAVNQRSGGEKARLVLAILAYQKPNLLLLDEPTNHLDINTRDALSIALQNYSGAVLIISHDRHLLRTITDQWYLVRNRKLEIFDGDLDDYRETLKLEFDHQQKDGKDQNTISRREQRHLDAERRKQLRPLQVAVEKAENNLEKLHLRVEVIEDQLSDPEIYSSDSKENLTEILKEKGKLERQVCEAEKIWEEAIQDLDDAEINGIL